MLDDVVRAEGQIFNRDLLFYAVLAPVNGALAKPGEIEYRFAEGFARNGPGIDADPTDDRLSLDDPDLLVELGCLDRSLLAGGSRADD